MGINFITADSQGIFAVPMYEVFGEFIERHEGWLMSHIGENDWRKYFESIVENMVSHMEYENIGIPSYVEYCSHHLIEGGNMAYLYHPYKYIRFMSEDAKVQYLRLLSGFASHFFSVLQEMGYYDYNGVLKGAYQGCDLRTLYLAARAAPSPLIA